jgi:hypothetical protein
MIIELCINGFTYYVKYNGRKVSLAGIIENATYFKDKGLALSLNTRMNRRFHTRIIEKANPQSKKFTEVKPDPM